MSAGPWTRSVHLLSETDSATRGAVRTDILDFRAELSSRSRSGRAQADALHLRRGVERGLRNGG
jgi:hypothetical protein